MVLLLDDNILLITVSELRNDWIDWSKKMSGFKMRENGSYSQKDLCHSLDEVYIAFKLLLVS